jgi:SAM-dependent methyltransferase
VESSQREEQLQRWEQGAAGWAKRADRVREVTMPVSTWMIEHLALQPGQRVLDLAAGPGDTGFMAAELIKPAGTLICSDGTEAMLEVARARARELGIDNVEFKRLELEWIDLPIASVDAALCRWALMLLVDAGSALQECRRVLRPGGRFALAVWDVAERNPWATIPGRALVELGLAAPPDPDAPGMFSLSDPARLRELLEGAGFGEVVTEPVEIPRAYADVEEFVEETLDLSGVFSRAYGPLDEEERAEVRTRIESLAAPFSEADRSLRFPGVALAAAAQA